MTPGVAGDLCRHGSPGGDCPSCAACAACDGSCGTCPYAATPPPEPVAARLREVLTETLGLDWRGMAGEPDGHEVAADCAAALWRAGFRLVGDAPSADAATLAAITALATAALAERRRGCPTYGLVSAARVLELVESTNQTGETP